MCELHNQNFLCACVHVGFRSVSRESLICAVARPSRNRLLLDRSALPSMNCYSHHTGALCHLNAQFSVFSVIQERWHRRRRRWWV